MIPADLDIFTGHYPGHPIMPGVLLCEAVFQTGALLMAKMQERGQRDIEAWVPVLARIGGARFKRSVYPGDTMVMTVKLTETLSSAWFFSRKTPCSGKLAVQIDFSCTLQPARSEKSIPLSSEPDRKVQEIDTEILKFFLRTSKLSRFDIATAFIFIFLTDVNIRESPGHPCHRNSCLTDHKQRITSVQLSITDMIFHAGPVGQLVMLTLLIFSTASWTIVFMKTRLFRKVRLDSEDFLETFWSSTNLNEAHKAAAEFDYSPEASVFVAGFTELQKINKIRSQKG